MDAPTVETNLPEPQATPEPVQAVLTVAASQVGPFIGQPRTYFDPAKMDELHQSILAVGQQDPVLVRETPNDAEGYPFRLVDGERRLLVCRRPDIGVIRVIVTAVADDDELYRRSFVKNFCREGHTPLESARGIARLLQDPAFAAPSKTAALEKIGKAIGKSLGWVNIMHSLLQLPEEVQAMIGPEVPEERRLNTQVAATLNKLPDPETLCAAARHIVDEQLPTGRALAHIRALIAKVGQKPGTRGTRPSDNVRMITHYIERITACADALQWVPSKDFQALLARSYTIRERLRGAATTAIENLRVVVEEIDRVEEKLPKEMRTGKEQTARSN